ncbi:MAG: 4Fe-4S binding protein [Gallionellaceae bacterium]
MSSLKFHWFRRATQLGTILLFILIPATGLFRIDLVAGNFVVLDRQIAWSDFNLMLGFMLMLAAGMVMTYSTIGTVWCGWACPQNTVSEWANKLTHKLLGKHANVDIESDGLQVAAEKNKVLNWIILGLYFFSASLVLGIIPFFYFFPPEQLWSLLSSDADPGLAQFMRRLYLVSVFAVFIDIAALRYFWCNYACLYRFGQRFFKINDGLHVAYDAERSSSCSKCNYCASSCIVGINPSQFKSSDTCIDCGECIDACDKLQGKNGKPGLLQFKLGGESASKSSHGTIAKLLARLNWVALIFVIGGLMFAWGIHTYSPFNIVAYRSEKSSGITVSEYRIQVSNKMYAPAQLTLSIKGLPEGSYKLETEKLELTPASRMSVNLHISPELPKGLHRVIIVANGKNGWVGRFAVEHFSARN